MSAVDIKVKALYHKSCSRGGLFNAKVKTLDAPVQSMYLLISMIGYR